MPGDGRITGAEILSGPDPAPLRIAVLRQLATPGFSGQCCFYVSETAPIPLTPNAVTTVPLDIAVERNTIKGFLAADLMALSADAGAGSLPLRVVGPSNSLTIPVGNAMAGAFYPRMGQIANDSGGARREEGVPGIELLVRWTWCATGDASCAPPSPQPSTQPTPGTAPPTRNAPLPLAPRLGVKQAPVSKGKALVGLLCGGDAACEGRLSLLAPTAAGSATTGKAVTVVYGTASYRMAAGAKGTVAVKLNRRGKKLLAKHSRATVTARLAPKGGTATTAKLTLTRARQS